MRASLRNLLCAGAVAAVLAGPAPAALSGPVKTANGLVEGYVGSDPSVSIYRGIPFAAPPVGELRWRAPQPPANWEGVRQTKNFSPSCMQNMVHQQNPWTWEFMPHGAMSEDCLYLNIWTAARSGSEKRPVFLYIHGGAYTGGSSEVAIYDGTELARKGVVVVVINYRVGVLGFFAHPELSKESGHGASGNQGLLDQVAALEWVRKNIAAFGGDPGNVTIGGQSAGAGSVGALLASPLAKGLFHRAIAESGLSLQSITGPMQSLADAEAAGVRFAEGKGAKSLAELRALPHDKLTGQVRVGPIVDGYFLTADMASTYAQGKLADVPVMTGFNADENGASPKPNATAATFQQGARTRYRDTADEVLKLYPATNDEQARAASNAAARDQQRTSVYLWALKRAQTSKSKAFIYFWNHAMPGPDIATYGAFHTSELPYAFNTLWKSDRPFEAPDRKIAETMSSYWVNFMKTGDPNGKGLPLWPAVDPAKPVTMELGDRMAPIPVAEGDKFELWKRFLSR